jgi:hypothetical protein
LGVSLVDTDGLVAHPKTIKQIASASPVVRKKLIKYRTTSAITAQSPAIGFRSATKSREPSIEKCALKHCGPFAINESAADLHAVFKLAPDFSTAGMAEFQHLFPGSDRDPFYKAALDIKRRVPDAFPYCEFASYETT